jgi:alkanesulfonate monooxygenase SsuD/methylene tetrahydromethanopterin reductase-like flavin-dependent oxidoreductase (luciferase family)
MTTGEIMCRLIDGTQEQVQSEIEDWKKEKGEDDAVNIENRDVELSQG